MRHVFISYRHENAEHARSVRRLGEFLRQANIPVALDQFYLDEFPAGPDLGWPKWCEDHANESACVLIIGSEGWFSAYEKTGQPGVGLGAATEADLFRQWLYDEGGDNPRIRLAFLRDIATQQIPVWLRAWHHFRPFASDDQLDQLIRWISDRLGLGISNCRRSAGPNQWIFAQTWLTAYRNGRRSSNCSRVARGSGFYCLRVLVALENQL
jgi:SEFIR domain